MVRLELSLAVAAMVLLACQAATSSSIPSPLKRTNSDSAVPMPGSPKILFPAKVVLPGVLLAVSYEVEDMEFQTYEERLELGSATTLNELRTLLAKKLREHAKITDFVINEGYKVNNDFCVRRGAKSIADIEKEHGTVKALYFHARRDPPLKKRKQSGAADGKLKKRATDSSEK